jgi:hypothetical protein
MALLPHDTADLALAPVMLHLEHEIAFFSDLSPEEVAHRIVLETNSQPRTYDERRDALVQSLTRFIDLHGWDIAVNERGVRVSHHQNAVTIGLPKSVHAYLDV